MSVNTIKEPHKVRVRKSHICQGCGKKINIGDIAITSTYSDGGDIWTFYECDDCVDYRNSKCCKCKDYDLCMGENYQIGLIKDCKKESLFNQ